MDAFWTHGLTFGNIAQTFQSMMDSILLDQDFFNISVLGQHRSFQCLQERAPSSPAIAVRVGVVHKQLVDGVWQHLAFFSWQLRSYEQRVARTGPGSKTLLFLFGRMCFHSVCGS